MKKKSLINVALICVMSMLLFSCIVVVEEPEGDPIAKGIASSLNTIRNIYNTHKQVENVTAPNDFYVEIGELEEAIELENVRVTVGTKEFKNTDKIKLSIGNSSYINTEIFKINGRKVSVASPVLQMELDKDNANVKIGDKVVYTADSFKDISDLKVKGIYWNNNESLSKGKIEFKDNIATIEIPREGVSKIGKTMLGIDFRYGRRNQTPVFYLTSKESKEEGGVTTYEYGATNQDKITSGTEVVEQEMLGYYPYGWDGNDNSDFNMGKADDTAYQKKVNYKCKGCVVENYTITVVASGSITLNLSRAAASEEPVPPELE